MFETYSLWDKLKDTTKPIIIYGTGNGADKIINILNDREIKISGIFASDGFVRDRFFRDYKVQSYQTIIDTYGNDIIVLLAFGTNLKTVIDKIIELDRLHDLIIPDVPLYGGKLFDYTYFENHYESILSIYNLLEDDISKENLANLVNFRLTGKLKYLSLSEDFKDSLYYFFNNKSINTIIDGGAFKGDTCADFISSLSPRRIYAVEADKKTFIKLQDYASQSQTTQITPMNISLSDYIGTLDYSTSGSRGAGQLGKNKRAVLEIVETNTIDNLFGNAEIDLIKLDVEGCEKEVLNGSINLLKNQTPNLIISLYHKTDDFITITDTVHNILPSHKIYFRKVPCIPFWDINLFAIKE